MHNVLAQTTAMNKGDRRMVLAYSYLRFSSGEQRKGDSYRRQVKLRDEWLQRHKVPLDTSLHMEDLGVSAFHGKNAAEGALKGFLDAVAAGLVKPGAYLLIENLDRLSRDAADAALSLFLGLLNAGVVVVTLSPEREFRKGASPWQLMEAIVEFMRGNSESTAKSGRSRANWEKRRGIVARGEGLLTAKVPAWVTVREGRPSLDEAKADTVRRIFKLCLEGNGCQAIACLLNREKVPVLSPRARFWHDGVIYKILTGRAAVGEWTPMARGEDRKRHPVGPPVKDYFPPVVPLETFYLAQAAIKARSKEGCGRQDGGHGCSNLFRGLVVSPAGVPYTFRRRNGHDYLVLKNARTGGPDALSVAYPAFEQTLLRWLVEVRVGPPPEGPDPDALDARAADIERRIGVIKGKIKATAREGLFDVLFELQDELKKVKEQAEAARLPKGDPVGTARSLVRRLETAKDKDALRRQVRQQLRALVGRVVVLSIEGRCRTPAKAYTLRIDLSGGPTMTLSYRTDARGKVVEVDARAAGDGDALAARVVEVVKREWQAVAEGGERTHWDALTGGHEPIPF
jgi:DNA invertase Pin-like site-specific DNA recombinase